MFYLLCSVLSLALLATFAFTLCRLHRKQELLYQLPAVGLTFFIIVVETALFLFPSLAHGGLSILLLVQIVLCPAWLLFSLSYGREASFATFNKTDRFLLIFSLLPLVIAIFLPSSSFYYQTDFAAEPVVFLEKTSFYFYLFIVVMYMITAGNLESTLHNSKHSEQWRIKLGLLGIGIVMIAFMIFSSQGLLYSVIDISNVPLRNSGLCVGLLLVLYAEWRRGSSAVLIPHKIAFRSMVAFIAGLYLLGLGLAREGNRLFGGNFTHSLFFAILGIVFCLVLVLLLSQSLRRKMMIWIQRNLYDEKYDYRKQWVQFSERLSQATDYSSFIEATLVSYCETFGRVGAFYLPVDQNTSSNGIGRGVYYEFDDAPTRLIPAEHYAMLLHLPPKPLFVDEKNFANLPYDLFLSLARMQIGIVLPIRAADEPEGALFLGQPINGKEKYDVEDFELMEAMGRQTGLSAKSFRLSEEMAINREMEAIGRLGTFVLHDLKNQVYALSLLTDNARRFITNPGFQADMLETLGNTVANMKILITQLTHLPGAENLRFARTNLYDLVVKACRQFPEANIIISGKKPEVTVDVEQITKVVVNLCLNAAEAGGKKPIRVEIDEEEVPVFHIHDTAGGIAEEIMQAGVFKPFNSTKQRGMGIGLYHSKKIIEAHGAKIIVNNQPGIGCTFTVRFEGEKKLKGELPQIHEETDNG